MTTRGSNSDGQTWQYIPCIMSNASIERVYTFIKIYTDVDFLERLASMAILWHKNNVIKWIRFACPPDILFGDAARIHQTGSGK